MNSPKCPVTSEQQAIDCVVAQLHRQMEHDYPPGQMRRDAHPKMHGCVQAEVTIDRDLPADLRHGVFAHPGKTYPAWIRYSNGFHVEPDLKADARGMAVKLLGVEGEFIGDEQGTQDFLAATFNAFFIPDAFRYIDFPAAAGRGSVSSTAFLLRRRLWRGLGAAFQSLNTLAMNPLAITYFSQAPFSLGPHVVKYQFKPVITESLGQSLPWSPLFQLKSGAVNALVLVLEILGLTTLALRVAGWAAPANFLHRELARSLQRCDGWFEILVQRQAAGMSIEDATQSWDTDVSPYCRVASVRIPRQVFSPAYSDDPDRKAAAAAVERLGENISMSPWHALREHEPVGSINRARRLAYPASSRFRHESNGVPRDPPTVDDFKQLARIIRLAPDSIDPKPRAAVVEGSSPLAYLYLRRVPLLIALAFVTFPLISIAPPLFGFSPRTFTQGIFDVQGGSLYLASFVAFQLAFAIMTSWWVITTYASERWRVAKRFGVYPIRLRWYAASALLALPAVLATGFLNFLGRRGRSDWIIWAGAWIAGLAAALVTSAAIQWLSNQLPSVPPVKMLGRWLSRYPNLSDGYIDRERECFLPGHLCAFGAGFLALTTYITVGALTLSAVSFSALVFFLLLLLILCLPLSGLTFFFDRFRLPSLALLIVLAVTAHGMRGAAHVFRISDVSSAQPTPSPAPSPTTIVVVTASGGGTQAAVWLTRVLTGIDQQCRQSQPRCDLFSAIRLISGTSGGSVGAMYVASAYENGRVNNATSLETWAAESVEDPLWRELIYRDIYRPLRVFTKSLDYDDRAQALERAWRRHIADVRLSDWTRDAESGRRPAVIFNATNQSTGRRVLFSTTGTVRGNSSPLDFSQIYPGKEVDVATAVRLSATFPLVVPFARDDQHLKDIKFVDGGYADLFGVASATEWLQGMLSGGEHVLILQVRTPILKLPVTWGFPNWTNQFDDDQERIELLRSGLKDRGRCMSSVSFELGGEPAIEWRLTGRQQKYIDDQWKSAEIQAAVDKVTTFFTDEKCK